METNTIAVVILSTGTSHKINQETYDQICMAGLDDMIELPSGARFKNSGVMDILSVGDFERQHPNKEYTDYHQPYTELPAKGIAGLLETPKSKNSRAALLRGLEKAKVKLGNNTPNLDLLIKQVKNKQYAK